MRENTGINKIFLLGQIATVPQLYNGKVKEYHFTLVTKEIHEKQKEEVVHLEYHHVKLPVTLLSVNTQPQKNQVVHIEGKIHTRGWTDEQGVKRYTTEIIATQINTLD